jgi:trehalose synthase
MMAVREVPLIPRPIDRWRDILDAERWSGLEETLASSRGDYKLWNVNSTGAGGGVAEMLHTLLSYGRGSGIDANWAVIGGDPDFFRVTKRLHNFIHGHPGDGGDLSWQQRNAYHRTIQENLPDLLELIEPGSVVLLHDPQTAGLVTPLQLHGCTVIWRCHIGTENPNEYTQAAWSFIEPFISNADALVFTRAAFIPAVLSWGRTALMYPSIDPFAPKNQRVEHARACAIMRAAGVCSCETPDAPIFYRLNGQTDTVRTKAVLLGGSHPLAPDQPYALQVSRWDRLKDHLGVMNAWVGIADRTEADLVLAGPHAEAVSDDPEGAGVLAELLEARDQLPGDVRHRVRIVSLPMQDLEENAVIVNALQDHATVVVQKSLQEGFGLTVTEAMWKGKCVVATRVGGIQDQITHGQDGILLDDPTDLQALGETLVALLNDPGRCELMGQAAHDTVLQRFLHDRHARRYLRLFASLRGG